MPDETHFSDNDKALNIKNVFVERSQVKDDELIKYFMIKHNIKKYQCEMDRCPTKNGLWRRIPCYLELVRKNSKAHDLRISNLMLMCPNCYCQNKGHSNFKIIKNKIEHKCISCAYVLSKNNRSGLCYVCTKSINKGIVNSSFNSVSETAEITAFVNQEDYNTSENTTESNVCMYEDYLNNNINIDFTNNNIFTSITNPNPIYNTNPNPKHKQRIKNSTLSHLDNTQTEYNLDINDTLLMELENI